MAKPGIKLTKLILILAKDPSRDRPGGSETTVERRRERERAVFLSPNTEQGVNANLIFPNILSFPLPSKLAAEKRAPFNRSLGPLFDLGRLCKIVITQGGRGGENNRVLQLRGIKCIMQARWRMWKKREIWKCGRM